MSDAGGQPELRIYVIGAFRVLAQNGDELTPSGRKARALLAMLALTPTRRRSRPALQDKLWSDRGPEQGAASLRQTLTEIRRAFGDEYRSCLVSDMRGVELAPDRVGVDLDTADLSELARQTEPPQLLEDIDVADEEFEHWLRNQRTAFEQRITSSKSVSPFAPAPTPVSSPTPSPVLRSHPAPALPWIRVLPPLTDTGEHGPFLASMVGSRIVQGLMDQWAIDFYEDGKGPQGVQLRVDALPISGQVAINVVLFTSNGATQLWSCSETIPLAACVVSDTPRLQALIGRSIEVTGYYLNRIAASAAGCEAFTRAFDAVRRMFKIDRDEVDGADALLRTAHDLDPKPIYLAWRAYARSFYVGENLLSDRRSTREEAEELARRALEAEPHNSTVLALSSYVYSFILHEFSLGHELAEMSVRFNPAHPLGHASLGRANSYFGAHDAGYRETCRALRLSGQTPYRCSLHFLNGMTALLSGRFKEAVRAFEIARSLAPTYRAPQRCLVPLYLKLGERDKALTAFERLRRLEPSFSLAVMCESSYPSAGIRASGLLTFSDRDL